MYIQFISIYLCLAITFLAGGLLPALKIEQLESTKGKHSLNCNLAISGLFNLLLKFECVLWP